MSANIHPTAIIDSKAELGADVEIGPYCVVGPNVSLADKVKLHSHVVVDGHTSIGSGSEIFPFAVLGCPPQHTRYAGEKAHLKLAKIMSFANM